MVAFATRNPRSPLVAPPVVSTVLPNDAAWTYSDLAGSWSVTASRARATRPIVDEQGYEHCAPGARASIVVSAVAPTLLTLRVRYTGLVTRTDTYADVGTVMVNGAAARDFACPVPKSGPHPISAATVLVPVGIGSNSISVIWPYCASLDLEALGLPAGVTLGAAPARPSKRIVGFGDSRTHGFNVSRALASWLDLAAAGASAQALNLGYGGRQIIPADGTAAGGLGADGAVYLCGFNNFYGGGASLPAVQAAYELLISNYRAAAVLAGKPASKLVMLSDLYSTSDVGQGGPYAGNSPTLQQFRNAMQAAVTAVADANTVFLAGNAGGMPIGTGTLPDGVHPNDVGASIIGPLVQALLP
jgi:hypothetical protein